MGNIKKKCLQQFLILFVYLKEQFMFQILTYFKKHSPSGLLATLHLLKQAAKQSSC